MDEVTDESLYRVCGIDIGKAGMVAAKVPFRIGSGDTASLGTLRIVIHRPLPGDADVTMMQVTVTGRR